MIQTTLSLKGRALRYLAAREHSRAELERKRKEKFQYTGEKLSLNFQDIEVRSVLQLIADFTDLNLVLGAWNTTGPQGDIAPFPDGDGTVNFDDLNEVLANWGTTCP